MKSSVLFSFIASAVVLLVGFPSVYGPLEQPQLDDRNYNDLPKSKAIPDWVKNQFEWFLDGKIDENTLLTSMNWMFDNNIMFLSPQAALEVQQLRDENNQYRELLGHEISHTVQQASSDSANSSQTSTGERIMQPEFGADQSKVTVRGWDNVQKEPIEGNKKVVAKFLVELYAESMSLSDEIWLPMKEGEVLMGFEDGDPDKPIIVGRIYSEDTESSSGVLLPNTVEVAVIKDMGIVQKTINDIYGKGGSTSDWQEGILTLKTSTSSVNSDLQGIVVLCNTVFDSKLIEIDSELTMLEELIDTMSAEQTTLDATGAPTENQYESQQRETDLNFITKRLDGIEKNLTLLDNGMSVLDEELNSEDTKVSNLDLQNKIQEQQQHLQTISGLLKTRHDAAMNAIRNMK